MPGLVLLGCSPELRSGAHVQASRTPSTESSDPDPHGGVESVHATCGLQHNLDQPYLWEGQTVVFQVWCDRSANTETVQIDVAAPSAPGAVFTPEGTFSWFTDGRDGGRHTFTITAQSSEGGLPETLLVDVWLADNPDASYASPPTPATYTEEWGLPVVHIEHDGALSTDKVPGRFTVRGETVSGEVKLRGATSLAYPKNSFTLDFDGGELQVDEWGSKSRGHLILTSTFDDNSYLRHKLTFDVWADMAESSGDVRLAPKTFFTVVYINGAYQGLYVGTDRVDDELARHSGFDGEGDLFKAVSHSANYSLQDEDGIDKEDLAMGWEKKHGPDEADLTGIRDLTAAIGAMTAEDFDTHAGADLQVGSFIDWYLLAMVGFTEDSVGKNHYVYQDAASGLWTATPWDFNASWGQSWKTLRRDADRVRDHTEDNRIFALLESADTHCAELKARYADVHAPGAALHTETLLGRVDDYVDRMGPAAARDQDHWGDAYRSFFRWTDDRTEDDDWTDFEGEVAYIRAWIPAREATIAEWIHTRCDTPTD